jgi:hypothetical protein
MQMGDKVRTLIGVDEFFGPKGSVGRVEGIDLGNKFPYVVLFENELSWCYTLSELELVLE